MMLTKFVLNKKHNKNRDACKRTTRVLVCDKEKSELSGRNILFCGLIPCDKADICFLHPTRVDGVAI